VLGVINIRGVQHVSLVAILTLMRASIVQINVKLTIVPIRCV